MELILKLSSKSSWKCEVIFMAGLHFESRIDKSAKSITPSLLPSPLPEGNTLAEGFGLEDGDGLGRIIGLGLGDGEGDGIGDGEGEGDGEGDGIGDGLGEGDCVGWQNPLKVSQLPSPQESWHE